MPEGDVMACDEMGNNCYPSGKGKQIAETKKEQELQQQKKQEAEKSAFSYGDKLIESWWPTPYDLVYVELRRNEVVDAQAKDECVDGDTTYPNNVICGIFKIGNLMQIMQRLGNMACTSENKAGDRCPDSSVFEISSSHPPFWATASAPYTTIPKELIWVPAHNPYSTDKHQQSLAERDEFVFFTLYKLYQMSLVDTSKLVTGPVPITISK
jgi:hypothetical protein